MIDQCVTVNAVALVAVPPAVVRLIGPLLAPDGTLVRTDVEDRTR